MRSSDASDLQSELRFLHNLLTTSGMASTSFPSVNKRLAQIQKILHKYEDLRRLDKLTEQKTKHLEQVVALFASVRGEIVSRWVKEEMD